MLFSKFMLKMMSKIKFIHIFWFFFYFFIFSLLLRGSLSYLDPDFGWHLRVGQEIAQTQLVPQVNYYNYTFSGNWVDHEWLSNWALYEIYNSIGYIGLAVVFSLLIILVLILLNVLAHRIITKSSLIVYIVIFQTIGLIASLPHLGIRIQEFGLLFILLLLIIIYSYQRTKKWRFLVWLIPLFYLWSCWHASFLLGLLVLLMWLLIKIGERFLFHYRKFNWIDYSERLTSRNLALVITFFLLSIGITFLTPYRQELYSFLGGYGNTIYLSYIQEWLSQFSYPFVYWQLFYLAIVVVALILYFFYNRQKINLWTVALVLLFFVLSFKSRRHFPLLFVVSFIFLLESYIKIFGNTRFKINYWLKIYVLFCLIMAISWQWLAINLNLRPETFFSQDYPVQATEFLKSNPQYSNINIFNDYVWGGYLIWVYPEKKLFIDGRLPQVRFANHTFLEEYLDFFKENTNIKEKISDYNIGLIMIKSQDKELKPKKWERLIFGFRDEDFDYTNYLRKYLVTSTDWRVIYSDQTAIIYFRE